MNPMSPKELIAKAERAVDSAKLLQDAGDVDCLRIRQRYLQNYRCQYRVLGDRPLAYAGHQAKQARRIRMEIEVRQFDRNQLARHRRPNSIGR